MAAEAPELLPLDFMTLPRYEVYTTFQCGGKSTGWISAKTLAPSEPLRLPAELKAESMSRYGVPAEETERELIRLIAHAPPNADPVVTDSPIGRKRKPATGSSHPSNINHNPESKP